MLDLLVHQEVKVLRERKDHRVVLDQLVPKDLMATLDHQDLKVHLVLRDNRVQQVILVSQGLQDQLDNQVHPAHLEQLEIRGH